ncbi:MAG: hypothetical protein H8D65_01410, partial [Spirochaetes bacterium]|nr:hypothetical protein [Spirochaetota bacterium]
MRGITIRQGNILIGEENFLSEYFTEKRFVTWCIGEIYVSKNIKVNARRDGFEHTEEYETLVEQFGLLGSYLSNICRQASNIRSKKQNEQVLRNQMESIKDHSIAVNKEHKENLERFVYKAGYEKPTEVIDKIVLLE